MDVVDDSCRFAAANADTDDTVQPGIFVRGGLEHQRRAQIVFVRCDLIALDLELFTELLEQYRESAYVKAPADKEVKISPQYEKQAIEFLSKPDLVKRWNDPVSPDMGSAPIYLFPC